MKRTVFSYLNVQTLAAGNCNSAYSVPSPKIYIIEYFLQNFMLTKCFGHENLELTFRAAPKSIGGPCTLQTIRSTGKNTLQAILTSKKIGMESYSRHIGKSTA